MTIQLSAAVRNAMLDAIETAIGTSAVLQVFSGSMPANTGVADSGTLLVEFDLASDWAAAASAGSKALNNLTLSATAVAGAPTNAGYFRIKDSTKTTVHMQGTITATGGGGDATMDNISIASGQTIQIPSWSWTEPGA